MRGDWHSGGGRREEEERGGDDGEENNRDGQIRREGERKQREEMTKIEGGWS